MKKINHNILVLSGKGGVGKSTVSLNLAALLAERGYSVGALDADIHGPNLAHMLKLNQVVLDIHENKLKPLEVRKNLFLASLALIGQASGKAYIWRGPIKTALVNQLLTDMSWPFLDYLIIDCPPGTGDEPLTASQVLSACPSKGAIIVTTPQSVAVLDASRAVDFAHQLKIPVLGMIENMSGYIHPTNGTVLPLFGQGGGRMAAEKLNVPFLGSLPFDPRLIELTEEGKVLSEGPTSINSAFLKIIDQIEATMTVG